MQVEERRYSKPTTRPCWRNGEWSVLNIFLFAVGDNGANTISEGGVAAGENESVDEGNDDHTDTNPGEDVKRCGLSWLYKAP